MIPSVQNSKAGFQCLRLKSMWPGMQANIESVKTLPNPPQFKTRSGVSTCPQGLPRRLSFLHYGRSWVMSGCRISLVMTWYWNGTVAL